MPLETHDLKIFNIINVCTCTYQYLKLRCCVLWVYLLSMDSKCSWKKNVRNCNTVYKNDKTLCYTLVHKCFAFIYVHLWDEYPCIYQMLKLDVNHQIIKHARLKQFPLIKDFSLRTLVSQWLHHTEKWHYFWKNKLNWSSYNA